MGCGCGRNKPNKKINNTLINNKNSPKTVDDIKQKIRKRIKKLQEIRIELEKKNRRK